jgi:UDP-N-acetylmuramyl pentapeptide phosphotransferase/UDP-N-acetylglucosamine-1-phosphate transferase
VYRVLFCILAFPTAALLTDRLRRPGSSLYLLDVPNERSLHSQPTPRTGGIAILVAAYLGAMITAMFLQIRLIELACFGGIGLFVAGVSFLDDRFDLPPVYRLATHIIAASLVLMVNVNLVGVQFAGLQLTLPRYVTIPIALLFIVWMINLYNFMDGMDGFAGGMTVFGFGTFALLGWRAGHEAFVAANLSLTAAAAGFLLLNFPPARIFMGDVGSTTLGFFAAAFMLWAQSDRIFPFWAGIVVFSPFIVDATVTLLRRILQKERIWQGHRSHYYQRLVQLGWKHRKTVLWEYFLMMMCASSTVWAVHLSPLGQWLLLGFWAIVYVVLTVLVLRLEHSEAGPEAGIRDR